MAQPALFPRGFYHSLHPSVHMVGPQGKFATGPQGPAKKLEKLDCAKACVPKTKLQCLFRAFFLFFFFSGNY